MRSILVIDDEVAVVEELKFGLRTNLKENDVAIHTWQPTHADSDPRDEFDGRIDNETTLVVTDENLTASGRTGLFGFTIVEWCHVIAIPVGVYSRKVAELPQEPSLFKIRVPSDATEAVAFVASVFRGFRDIDQAVLERPDILDRNSPAAVLAAILGTPDLESQYALYGGRFGTAGGALLARIKATVAKDIRPDISERRLLVTYIIGHLLLNAILEFPGPIVSSRALAAYTGCHESETDAICELFVDATYKGPFSDRTRYFWLAGVDQLLNTLTDELGQDFQAETHGEIFRQALQRRLSRELAKHDCSRCQGVNGGFFCPFTQRTVCLRADCSVGSSSWIPQGASLCRIERDFYDEWAPVLGI